MSKGLMLKQLIKIFQMHAIYGGDVELDFHFKSRVHYSLWKACIEAALTKLDISESALRGNFMPRYAGIECESVCDKCSKRDRPPLYLFA